MAVAYPFGPFYFQKIRLKSGSPIFHTASTHEQSEPFRHGRALIAQYWPGHAIVVGWWTGKHMSEDSALMAGMQAHEDQLVDDNGKLLERFRVREAARKTVARNSADPDEEWEILSALALDRDEPDGYICDDEDDEDEGEASDTLLRLLGLDDDEEER